MSFFTYPKRRGGGGWGNLVKVKISFSSGQISISSFFIYCKYLTLKLIDFQDFKSIEM